MFGLKGRQDGFRLLLPKEFLVPEVEEKYAGILKDKIGYFDSPIDFLNETIQKVNVLGFQDGTMTQDQPVKGAEPTMKPNRIKQNQFQYAGSQFNYRSGVPPIQLTDKTFNITFRHTLGYLNYFMLFENFWYQFSRDMNYEDLPQRFTIDLFNEKGEIVTNGGRVLGVTAIGKDLKEARAKAYEATEWVNFANKYMRHDIGKAIDEA